MTDIESHGTCPTGMVLTDRVAVSITDTVSLARLPSPKFATYSRLPSGLIAIPSGNVPTPILWVTMRVAVSMTATMLPASFVA
jgi:hypothetical protein